MKTFALALGGGGARGLAHLAVIEALDSLGLKPVAIAGTSIGAAIGAAYAAGMSGRAMRRYVIDLVHNRADMLARLMRARAGPWRDLFSAGFGKTMVLDPAKFCAEFLPEGVPQDFAALQIPITIVAADLYGRCEVDFDSGPLRPAIAASMAVPGLLQPMDIDGRILVDGGAVNPLPFDLLRGKADVVVAVEGSPGPTERHDLPDPWDALFTTLQVMGHTIIAEKLKHGGAPDLLLRPNVGVFRLLDFPQASSIIRAAEPLKREIAEKLPPLLA